MESFVPGTLERMGLGWDVLRAWNPRLILVRISGWGQTGPASQRPGFGTLVEAASGFAAMNGEPDGAPIVPSFPLADMTSALYAVNAIMFALYHRDVHGGAGQVIDVSLFESLFSLLGPLPAEYAALGKTARAQRQPIEERRSARLLPHAATAAGSRSADRRRRWPSASCSAYGLGDLLDGSALRDQRSARRARRELDAAVAAAIARAHARREPRASSSAMQLTAVAVQTVADIERDPHWQRAAADASTCRTARGTVRMHNVVPRLSETPGRDPVGRRRARPGQPAGVPRARPVVRRDQAADGGRRHLVSFAC